MSKTDRELLELAAEAAGYEVHSAHQAERDAQGYGDKGLWLIDGSTCWNPTHNRGDALQLQADIGRKYACCVTGVFNRATFPYASASIVLADGSEVYIEQEIGDDIAGAIGLALVRAAAAIGEQKR